MALKVVTPPAVEAITLEEAKNYLRVDVTDDDILISDLITAARMFAEAYTWRAILPTTYEYYLESWPVYGVIELPNPPLISVDFVRYTTANNVQFTLDASSYIVDTANEPGRVILKPNYSWPADELLPGLPIVIRFTAGYAVVPKPVRQAMLMLVAHWYENREAAGERSIKEIAFAVESLLGQYRFFGWS